MSLPVPCLFLCPVSPGLHGLFLCLFYVLDSASLFCCASFCSCLFSFVVLLKTLFKFIPPASAASSLHLGPSSHTLTDGSGFHARRVHIVPVLAPVLVADLRSDRSRMQCPFRQTLGKAHTTRLLSQTHVCPARGFPPGLGRISSQNIFQ